MEYIALDIETTGLSVRTDRITEFAAVHMVDGVEVDCMQMLINPNRPIGEDIAAMTGISDKLIQEEQPKLIGEEIGKICAFCADYPLVGHHLITDFSFLKKAAQDEGITFEHRGIDTLALMRTYVPECEKKNLQSACAWFGYSGNGYHRAMEDARATAWLYQTLMNSFPEIGFQKGTFLEFKVKKEKTMTKHQKQYLIDLIKYHRITLTIDIDALTRSEASRLTDHILAEYGRSSRN